MVNSIGDTCIWEVVSDIRRKVLQVQGLASDSSQALVMLTLLVVQLAHYRLARLRHHRRDATHSAPFVAVAQCWARPRSPFAKSEILHGCRSAALRESGMRPLRSAHPLPWCRVLEGSEWDGAEEVLGARKGRCQVLGEHGTF